MTALSETKKYQVYPEYKYSGIRWIGKIPSHWNICSLKRAIDGCTNGIWGTEPDESNDIIVLRVADFDRSKLSVKEDKLTLRSISPKEQKNRLLKKGDLLIEKSGGGEKTLVGCVVLFDKDFPAVTSNFVAKMPPKSGYDSRFLKYAFSLLYSGRVNFPSIKQTTGIQNLDSEAYLKEKFGFPIELEQTQIAVFLDHETTKIDKLIEKQQQLMKLLKEKRQAVISHAVTKGLNPDAPMKDSGVEWLGQVPEGWGVGRIGHYSRVINGSTPSKLNTTYWSEKGIAWLSSGSVNQYHITSPSNYITKKALQECSVELMPINTLVIGMIGQGKTRGLSAITKIEATINQNLAAIISDLRLDSMYGHLFLQVTYKELRECARGGNQAALNCELIGAYKITIPPIEEQKRIVIAINAQMKKFDELGKKAAKGIQLLQERRTALISAAVTGKIDVRHWQSPKHAKTYTIEKKQTVVAV